MTTKPVPSSASASNHSGAEPVAGSAPPPTLREAEASCAASRSSPTTFRKVAVTPDTVESMAWATRDPLNRWFPLAASFGDHCSVDSNGWCYDGPVEAWLALLHHASGNTSVAHSRTQRAISVATAFGDQRTLKRLAPLMGSIDHDPSKGPLTAGEIAVLRMVAQGCTNAQIVGALNFSVSTIRHTLPSLYDRAGVRTPASVVAYARAGGLLDTTQGACSSDTS